MNIPTVEEILVSNKVFIKPEISNFNLIIHRDCYIAAQENIKRAMIEFTKLHVEAALEKYTQEIEIKRVLCHYPPINFINKDDLKKAYPLENIK